MALFRRLLGGFVMKLGRARWVTVKPDDMPGYSGELAFRIFGVTFGYYKDATPMVWSYPHRIQNVRKREYGESIKPQQFIETMHVSY